MSLNLHALLAKKVLLVGGKGGVGKTTVSAALAVYAAAQKRRVLLVSTDPAHSLSDVFGRHIGSNPVHMIENLHTLELDPEKEVDAYLDRVLGQMRRYAGPDQIQELQRHLRLSRLSPGAQEAALLERIAQLLDTSFTDYDLIIFDTAPTGHTLRLFTLPEVMAAWTDGLLKHNQRSEQLGKVLSHLSPGRDLSNPLKDPQQVKNQDLDDRGKQLAQALAARQSLFHRTRRLLHDASSTSFLFVLTPERLPILETERAVNSLYDAGLNVAGLVVNRVLPVHLEGGFWQNHLQRQQHYLTEIDQRLGQLPCRQLLLQEQEIQGLTALKNFANQLLNEE